MERGISVKESGSGGFDDQPQRTRGSARQVVAAVGDASSATPAALRGRTDQPRTAARGDAEAADEEAVPTTKKWRDGGKMMTIGGETLARRRGFGCNATPAAVTAGSGEQWHRRAAAPARQQAASSSSSSAGERRRCGPAVARFRWRRGEWHNAIVRWASSDRSILDEVCDSTKLR
ncbi:hypothetical protein Syun_029529 [Stephania yunnanensis]|uniref:Uncharacterized protein n=1 Tax=Stephania yunnanensis TaxID=152371 RepID=A0AAP0HLG3_9MAGN